MLEQFVVYDMRNFSHCSEFVLDRIAFGDKDAGFAEAIKGFQTRIGTTTVALGFVAWLGNAGASACFVEA